MIAVESFKKFRWIDIFAIIVLAFLWLLLELFTKRFSSYILSLFFAVTLMTFAVHLIRKAGTSILFYVFGAFLTSGFSQIGATGSDKVVVMLVSGLLFEVFYLIFKLEIKNLQFDIIGGAALSSAVIPLVTTILISYNVALNMLTQFINLVLLSFFIGIFGSIVAYLIWNIFSTTKLILRFEYMR